MNSLQQYIDLYEAQREVFDSRFPEALNAMRPAALDALKDARLPRKGEEDYEATDVEAMLAPDFGVNVNRIDLGADPARAFSCDVPNMSTCQYFFFNDIFRVGSTARRHPETPVVVESFAEAQRNHPDVLRRYASLASLDEPAVALNTLLAQDGMLVYVPDGVTAPRTIQLVNILNASRPLMAVRRLLIVLGENAHARMLVCDHAQTPDNDFLSLQVVEIVAGKNSSFDYYDLEETGTHTRRLSTVYVDQQEGSNVLVNGMTLLNGMTRNNFRIFVNGAHADTQLMGMTIASGTQHVDNHTLISHNAPQCHSHEMFKYVLNDKAVGAFAGKILVQPDCPNVDAYQGNRNLCASAEAKMYTKPQLEIYTDDVKCSHGATIGQLDEEALFYMRSRGISLEEARTMLQQAFMSDIIDTVRLDVLRDRLRHLVEKRFSGTLALCQDCAACKR